MSDINTYADQTAIDALTPITGDLVLRESDNNVLLWNGSAWKSFAPDVASSSFSSTYSVEFDGTNMYMETGVPIVTGTTPISLSGWVYLTSTPSDYDQAIAIRGSTTWYSARMLGFVNGRLHFNTFASELRGTTSVSVNTWHHIAATSTSSGAARVYLNGVLEASGSITYNSVASGNTFVIAQGGVSEYLPAKIDEVAIWDSVLSDGGVSVGQTAGGDIATLYNSGVPTDISSLSPVGWWRMGENDSITGNTVTDQGSGGNDGTLTNGPTFSTDVPS